MVDRIFTIFIFAFACYSSACLGAPLVPPADVAVNEQPAALALGPGGAEHIKIPAATVGQVLERSGAWVKIRCPHGEGWLPSHELTWARTFRPVVAWTGPKVLEVGDGDYGARYTVRANGTFMVSEDASDGSDGYRRVKRKGQLLSHGKLIWAFVPGEPVRQERLFLRVTPAKLCWSYYLDGRCE